MAYGNCWCGSGRHELNLRVYHIARDIRVATYMSLCSQMVRAAGSVPANIVDGRDQKTDRQFAAVLRIALNSSSEREYHLLAARDLGTISARDLDSLVGELKEVRSMLYGLIRIPEKTAPGTECSWLLSA